MDTSRIRWWTQTRTNRLDAKKCQEMPRHNNLFFSRGYSCRRELIGFCGDAWVHSTKFRLRKFLVSLRSCEINRGWLCSDEIAFFILHRSYSSALRQSPVLDLRKAGTEEKCFTPHPLYNCCNVNDVITHPDDSPLMSIFVFETLLLDVRCLLCRLTYIPPRH